MQVEVEKLQKSLQQLVGLHRQLLEVVRLEKEALIAADVDEINKLSAHKQALITSISLADQERGRVVQQIAQMRSLPYEKVTLSKIIEIVQETSLEKADEFRTAFNTIKLLLQRITEINKESKLLVEKSLEHVGQMKSNVLGAAQPKSQTYTPKGKTTPASAKARWLSREA